MAARLDRARIRQPLVVHVHSDRCQFQVVRHVVAEMTAPRLERNGLTVFTGVEDDLGRDAVLIHLLQAHIDVVVTGRVEVGHPGAGDEDVRDKRRDVVVRSQGLLPGPHKLFERLEVFLGAVLSELLDQQRADVCVGRNHDDRLVRALTVRVWGSLISLLPSNGRSSARRSMALEH